THRMTELFGRLAPGATVEEARAELEAAHAAMMRQHPEAYPASAQTTLVVRPFSDQVTAPARKVLLMLLAAAGVVFAIACSHVATLIRGRTVRRRGRFRDRLPHRRERDPGAHRRARERARRAPRARSRPRRAAPDAARG